MCSLPSLLHGDILHVALQYHAQKINIAISTNLIHISPVLHVHICVYVCLALCNFITCVGSCNQHHC